jgi:hypothetical protein
MVGASGWPSEHPLGSWSWSRRAADVALYAAGTTPDNIESNITSVGVHTSSAAEELTTAHEYQRKAGRRKLWLMIILIIVVAVVLLAVRLRLLAAPTFTVTNVARALSHQILS